MGTKEGGSPNVSFSKVFEKLVAEQGKKTSKGTPLKFLKRIEDVSVIALPLEDTIRVALSPEERALIGQFTGLWSSPKSTENWVQRN